MKNQTNETTQKTLAAEYESNMKKSDIRLAELRTEKQEIEECQDELRELRSGMMAMIREQQDEYAQNDSHKDLAFYQKYEEEFELDYRKANNALQNKQDEIEHERKNVLRAHDDLGKKHKRQS